MIPRVVAALLKALMSPGQCSTDPSPTEMIFELQQRTSDYELAPPALIFLTEPFDDSDGITALEEFSGAMGTIRVADGHLEISHAAGPRGTIVQAGSDISMPQVWVEIEVVAHTGNSDSCDGLGVGIARDFANSIWANVDNRAGQLCLQVTTGGSSSSLAAVDIPRPAYPFKLALSIVGEGACIWTDDGSGWMLRTKVDFSSRLALRTTDLRGWRPAVHVVSDAPITVKFDNLIAGRFGAVGTRDYSIVIHEDGRPILRNGKVKLLATCVDPLGGGQVGILEFDCSTYTLTQVGMLMSVRDGGIYDDEAAHLVLQNDGSWRYVVSSWGNGFGGTLQILCKLMHHDITQGAHIVSGLTALHLPAVPADGGAYDPFITRLGDLWYIAYAVTSNTRFIPEDFYLALATTTDFINFTLVGEDKERLIVEGPKILVTNQRDLWVVGGGRGVNYVYNADFVVTGSISVSPPLFDGTSTQPHLLIFFGGNGFNMISWDATTYDGGWFTWGAMLVHKSSEVSSCTKRHED